VAADERSTDENDQSSSPEDAPGPVLEAKYLDYCSARLSEVFLSLSDERIYELVEEAAREGRLDVARLSFDEMVKLVTEKLQRSVPLPDFETWAREYREDPERYERHLMGLWERSADVEGTGEEPRGGAETDGARDREDGEDDG
jgi:hypothetical protein